MSRSITSVEYMVKGAMIDNYPLTLTATATATATVYSSMTVNLTFFYCVRDQMFQMINDKIEKGR